MTPNILLLNNYSGTGIGDFGLQLNDAIRSEGLEVFYVETNLNGDDFLSQLSRAYRESGVLVANIGLTAWGRSGIRNFLGFAALGVRGFRGGGTIVLLHNVIDIMDYSSTGYRVTRLTRFGARVAVWMLRKCRIVVFSRRLEEILTSRYGIHPSLIHPIPCVTPPTNGPPSTSAGTIVNVGYIAPYKGIELIAAAASLTKSKAKWVLIGGVHRVLESDSSYASNTRRLLRACKDAGIDVRGRLPEPEFRQALQEAVLGVLCYSSSSGASASFAAMASAGLPVVASDVPELREVVELGGGIVLVPPLPAEMARTVDRLYNDGAARYELAKRQLIYSEKYSWRAFVSLLAQLIERTQTQTAKS